MTLKFRLCFIYSILFQNVVNVVLGSVADLSNSSCVQAVVKPTVKTPCVPLKYNSYCSKKKILLDNLVFVTSHTQMENDRKLNQFQSNLSRFLITKKCEKAIDIVYCHHYFPRCDGTGDKYKAQTLCKETCQYFTNACNQELKILRAVPLGGSGLNIIDCAKFSLRNAGKSPECYYFDERDDENDCLHKNCRSYQGNISVTSSGIPCQSWIAKCPHRHTMVSTYPELKNASNYCRNQRGSGQRPWCFTSDRSQRWEYCDIPSCSPAVTSVKTGAVIPTKTSTIDGKIRHSATTITASRTVFSTTTATSTKITPTINTTKSMCSPANPLPAIQYPCTRLNDSYAAYCKKQGEKLDSYVFKNIMEQKDGSENLNRFQLALDTLIPFYATIKVSNICLSSLRTVYCHYYFPTCDQTGRQMREQKLCKSTCDFVMRICKEEIKAAERLNEQIHIINTWPYVWEIFNCTTFPTRMAGKSPECWYYNGKFNEINSSEEFVQNDCLYLSGRGYQGNISVTSSGIPCQSWTAQCPHRHTMVSTYFELKNASNYCRNPRSTGQRPWCFTSDKNKRWEYCDIPSCLPVNGGYGNWTLISGCNSTCGQGIEKWRRSCDAPAPKYDGNNCSSLGSATENRNCSDLPPCPINGNYGKWIRNSTCNVTCGDGFEMFIRKCSSPLPVYGGQNCSELGKDKKWEPCRMIPCQNPMTELTYALKIVIGAGVALVVLGILVIVAILGYRRMKRKYEPYATLRFDKMISMNSIKNTENYTNPDVASVHPQTYANLNENGEPLPGVCRGIIPYQQPYVNVASLNRPHYSKLQLFSSITLDWLRNTWGQVDELGKHVYDTLCRGMELVLPYDKPKKNNDDTARDRFGAIDENGNAVYDKFVRRPAVLMPGARVLTIPLEEMNETKTKGNPLPGENSVA